MNPVWLDHFPKAADEEEEWSAITNKLNSHGDTQDTVKEKAFWSHILKQMRETSLQHFLHFEVIQRKRRESQIA